MEVFAIMGFIFGTMGMTFGIVGFTSSMTANNQLKTLEKKVDDLKDQS